MLQLFDEHSAGQLPEADGESDLSAEMIGSTFECEDTLVFLETIRL